MKSPRITIVTPSFNQGEYIEEALLSVKSQSYPNVEHLVIDGGPTDATIGILQECSRRPGWAHLRWISEPDKGQSDALNKGFRLASGDIIGWLNSDDRYRLGALACMAKASQAYPHTDVLYGDYTYMDSRGLVRSLRREIEFSRFILHYYRVLYIPTTATFFRRQVFEEGNHLDIDLHLAMDYDFFLRLVTRGYRFQHVPALIADFRLHPQSKSDVFRNRHLREHDMLAKKYSPLFKVVKNSVVRELAFSCLRVGAATRRYSEKLLRGYYFERLPHATQSGNT